MGPITDVIEEASVVVVFGAPDLRGRRGQGRVVPHGLYARKDPHSASETSVAPSDSSSFVMPHDCWQRGLRLRQFLTSKPSANAVLWAATIGDTPDRAVSVLTDEESAVMRHCYADRTRPDRGVVRHESE